MPWKCPICQRVLKNPNAFHCCVKKDFDQIFKNKDTKLIFLFEKILSEVYDWNAVNVSATEKCIVFVSSQTFLVIKPMKSQLNIKFYLEFENHDFPIFKVAKYGRNFEHHIRISDFEEVDSQLISLIKASYNLFLPTILVPP